VQQVHKVLPPLDEREPLVKSALPVIPATPEQRVHWDTAAHKVFAETPATQVILAERVKLAELDRPAKPAQLVTQAPRVQPAEPAQLEQEDTPAPLEIPATRVQPEQGPPAKRAKPAPLATLETLEIPEEQAKPVQEAREAP